MTFSRLLAWVSLCSIALPNLCFGTYSTPAATLEIRPMACMVEELGQPCTMTVAVNWQIPEPLNVCLYQGIHSLSCWNEQSSIATELQITLNKTMTLTLSTLDGQKLASKVIQVNANKHRVYRRKLKSDWSLF